MRIVIVEDEAPIREGMEKILKKLSPSYVLAGKACDGLEGLEVIRREKPDVVIMDIRMPDMDGLTMLEKLREEGVTSKAVILSAYSDFSYAKRAMELGVSNYLLKPVKIQELRKVLQQMEEEVREENSQETLLSLENIARSALTGILEKTEETTAALEKKYGVPAILKIYLERISVTDLTFGYSEEGAMVGLCRASKLLYITTRGGNYAGTPMETATPVLKALCTMYGIPEFQCLDAEGLDDIRNDKEALLADAARRAEALAEVF